MIDLKDVSDNPIIEGMTTYELESINALLHNSLSFNYFHTCYAIFF